MTGTSSSNRRVGAIVLAAGASSRLGYPKQLLLDRGQPLVARMVGIAEASRCDDVAVVVGAEHERIADVLSDTRAIRLVNHAWSEGMASSIRTGIEWAAATDCDAALVMACDQPLVTADHLDRLLSMQNATGTVVASRYGAASGVPVVFPRRSFESLMGLRGDQGAARALDRAGWHFVELPDGAFDVDTEADVKTWRARLDSTSPGNDLSHR